MNLRKITKEELEDILEKHKKYLLNQDGGERADLSYVNLRCANLYNANLRNADLYYVNLSYVNLRCADLYNANLISTDLSYADLRNADLSDARLNKINTQDIEGTKIISVQVDTSRPNNKISYWSDLGIWTTGCFQGSLEELRERVENTHKNNEFLRKRYERAIEYILEEDKYDREKNK